MPAGAATAHTGRPDGTAGPCAERRDDACPMRRETRVAQAGGRPRRSRDTPPAMARTRRQDWKIARTRPIAPGGHPRPRRNRPNRSCWRPVRIRAPNQSAPFRQGKILVNPTSSPWCLKQTLLTVRRASAMKKKFVGGKGSSHENHSYRSARAGGGTEIGSALPRLAHIRGPHGPFLLPKFEKSQTISLERTPWSKI